MSTARRMAAVGVERRERKRRKGWECAWAEPESLSERPVQQLLPLLRCLHTTASRRWLRPPTNHGSSTLATTRKSLNHDHGFLAIYIPKVGSYFFLSVITQEPTC